MQDEEFIDENSYSVRLKKSKKILNFLTKPVAAGVLQGFWDSFYFNGFCIEYNYKFSVIVKDSICCGAAQ